MKLIDSAMGEVAGRFPTKKLAVRALAEQKRMVAENQALGPLRESDLIKR